MSGSVSGAQTLLLGGAGVTAPAPSPASAPAAKPSSSGSPGQPDWLRPLSRREVEQQAQNLVSKSYAPAYSDLDSQQAQIQAISDKRASDNKYYQQWLAEQQAKLQSSAQQFSAQTLGITNQSIGAVNSSYPAAISYLQGQADNRVGNVSNSAQNTQVGGLMDSQAQKYGALGSALGTQTTAMLQNNENARSATYANNLAMMAAQEAKQASDTWQALSAIGNERQKLKLQEAADTAKEIANMFNTEISKQSARAAYGLNVTKVGNTATHQANQDANANARTGIAQQNANNNTRRTNAYVSRVNNLNAGGGKNGKPGKPQKDVNDANLNNAYNTLSNHGINPKTADAGGLTAFLQKQNKIPQVVAAAAVDAYLHSGGKRNQRADLGNRPAAKAYRKARDGK